MANITNDADITALRDDFNVMRKDMATLVEHVRGNVANSANVATSQLTSNARDLYSSAASNGEQSAKVVYRQIEDHPVAAALIVLGAAYLGGRLITRS